MKSALPTRPEWTGRERSLLCVLVASADPVDPRILTTVIDQLEMEPRAIDVLHPDGAESRVGIPAEGVASTIVPVPGSLEPRRPATVVAAVVPVGVRVPVGTITPIGLRIPAGSAAVRDRDAALCSAVRTPDGTVQVDVRTGSSAAHDQRADADENGYENT